MKKILCLILALCLAPVIGVAEDIYALVDTMSSEELIALHDYVSKKIDKETEGITTDLTAQDILIIMEEAGFPIFGRVDYTEETDLNNQLGRPGMYTSKSNAYEKRANSSDEDPSDIKVEVFKNSEDCQDRYDYIDSLGSLAKEYLYKEANVLLRVSYDLLPAEAAEYEKALQAIINGGEVVTSYTPNTNVSAMVASDDFASRSNPAKVGQPVEILNEDVIITVEFAFQGENANIIAKSFDTYNTRYEMEKGEEWALVYLKIEGNGSPNDKISINDYDFHFVDSNGVSCGDTSYISGNPKELNDMFADGIQYAWYGMPVAKGTDVCLIYEPLFSDKIYAWFDIGTRAEVDTSLIEYEPIEKKAKGEEVERVQLMLSEYGCMKVAPSGTYDNDTIAAMKRFQKKAGLKQTGIADTETLKALFRGAKYE